jgi:hypothetical protein
MVQTLYAHLLSPIHATHPAHLILLDLITQSIFSDNILKETKSRTLLCVRRRFLNSDNGVSWRCSTVETTATLCYIKTASPVPKFGTETTNRKRCVDRKWNIEELWPPFCHSQLKTRAFASHFISLAAKQNTKRTDTSTIRQIRASTYCRLFA